jgi:hypothetical protein
MADPGAAPGEEVPAGAGEDPLRRLEQRLDRASQAAERLIAEAAAAATRRPPPAGWQSAAADAEETPRPGVAEWDVLLDALRGLRERIPPELQQRLGEALREVLMAVRALIDWYLERAERRRAEPEEVEEIPIL